VLFDRLMASFRERGNAGFLMYLADSIGYLGSVAVLIWRNFGTGEMSWLVFYTKLCNVGAGLVIVFAAASYWYFFRKKEAVSPQISTTINAYP